ncbi:chemotaxis protein CheW [Oscillatoria salina]|uniref:chemotaxis protein CheW n=1 Tax=Oscillatoria salina TaxID=331517 RepID=UPI001CCD6F00|nr:chemotaxis protein CheW [Oscillatoria salina]MBZ8178746.1 chemotaxis protein CheW [Oscillatoria salina IIICB1]
MKENPYLIFSLNNSLYGVEALSVEEVFFLPELTPVLDADRYLVGVVNLRGKIIPVIDLLLRLGYRTRNYQLTDSVVVLNWQNQRFGIVAHQVREVQNIAEEEISRRQEFSVRLASPTNLEEEENRLSSSSLAEVNTDSSSSFLSGIARLETEIVLLLNLENLLHLEPIQSNLVSELDSQTLAEKELLAERLFAPHATPEEKAIFRQRANHLRQVSESENLTGALPLAVINLNGELLGINLHLIREFTEIERVTPIPCTPERIVGNMNLRGEIVTLIDLRSALNLSLSNARSYSKAMIVEVEDLVAGITIENVRDVTFISPEKVTAVPAALHSTNDEYFQGTAKYCEQIVTILNLPKIFQEGGLIVDEEV